MSRRRRNDRGVALFIVIGAILVVFLLILGTFGIVRNETRLTANMTDGVVAFFLAEAGVEQAIFAMKRDLDRNDAFIDAVVAARPFDIDFDPAVGAELRPLVDGGRAQVKLTARYEPDEETSFGDARVGRIILRSQGIFHTPQGFTARKQVKVVLKMTAVNLGIVAPEHGLFVRDRRPQLYEVPNFSLDARDFAVMGGDIYLKGGMRCELTESIIDREFRPMGELGFMDLGYDTFNLSSLISGGVNFCHSQVIEYDRVENPITRKYFNFEGLGALLGPGSAWKAVEEPYMPGKTRRATRMFTNEGINLLTAEAYKKLATTKVDPYSIANPDGDARDNWLFRQVTFPGPLGMRSETFTNVLPLYGWGDWRRVPSVYFSNPTRRDDLSQAVAIDGITYVRGDVFLEGWYKGLGTLVVQGNIYVGGDVMGLPPPVTGYQSLLNLVVLEDPARESASQNQWERKTGKVHLVPHHDTDWDRLGLHLLRDMDPTLDIAIYAQNGLETDRSSIFDKFFNLDVEFNYCSEIFDWQKLPNDMTIYGTDPRVILGREGQDPLRAFLQPVISSEYLSWEEERPVL